MEDLVLNHTIQFLLTKKENFSSIFYLPDISDYLINKFPKLKFEFENGLIKFSIKNLADIEQEKPTAFSEDKIFKKVESFALQLIQNFLLTGISDPIYLHWRNLFDLSEELAIKCGEELVRKYPALNIIHGANCSLEISLNLDPPQIKKEIIDKVVDTLLTGKENKLIINDKIEKDIVQQLIDEYPVLNIKQNCNSLKIGFKNYSYVVESSYSQCSIIGKLESAIVDYFVKYILTGKCKTIHMIGSFYSYHFDSLREKYPTLEIKNEISRFCFSLKEIPNIIDEEVKQPLLDYIKNITAEEIGEAVKENGDNLKIIMKRYDLIKENKGKLLVSEQNGSDTQDSVTDVVKEEMNSHKLECIKNITREDIEEVVKEKIIMKCYEILKENNDNFKIVDQNDCDTQNSIKKEVLPPTPKDVITPKVEDIKTPTLEEEQKNHRLKIIKVQLEELEKLFIGTEKPVFEITVTDWKGQGILKTNKKALEKYGYTLTETTNKYGNKLTLVWEEQSLSEEDKSNHYKDMEKCQMQKLIKIFIDNPLVSDIIVWEYGKITTNNKQELKNWGYSCNEWSRYDDDQLKLELVDDDQ